VMDRLRQSDLPRVLNGEIFLSIDIADKKLQ